MRDKDIYARILGIEELWFVREVDLQLQAGEVSVYLDIKSDESLKCPVCGKKTTRYDRRERQLADRRTHARPLHEQLV